MMFLPRADLFVLLRIGKQRHSTFSELAQSMFTCAQLSHPPCPPIASQPISRDVPYAQARVFSDRALLDHPLPCSKPLPKGAVEVALDCAHRTTPVLLRSPLRAD